MRRRLQLVALLAAAAALAALPAQSQDVGIPGQDTDGAEGGAPLKKHEVPSPPASI